MEMLDPPSVEPPDGMSNEPRESRPPPSSLASSSGMGTGSVPSSSMVGVGSSGTHTGAMSSHGNNTSGGSSSAAGAASQTVQHHPPVQGPPVPLSQYSGHSVSITQVQIGGSSGGGSVSSSMVSSGPASPLVAGASSGMTTPGQMSSGSRGSGQGSGLPEGHGQTFKSEGQSTGYYAGSQAAGMLIRDVCL